MYVYIHTYIYIFTSTSLYNEYLGCFHFLAIVNNASMNLVVHLSFSVSVFILFLEIPRSGVDGSQGSSICNFLRSLRAVFHSNCINLHSHQQYIRIPFSSHPCSHFLFLVFLDSFSNRCEVICHCGFGFCFSDD